MAVLIVDSYYWDSEDECFYRGGERTINTNYIDHMEESIDYKYKVVFISDNFTFVDYDDFKRLAEAMNY